MTKVVVDTSGPVPSVVVDGVAWQPPPVVVAPPPLNSVDRTVYCTKAPHEAQPHGVPADWDWAMGPTVQRPTPGTDRSAIVWGQVYLAAGKQLPTNTRAAIRNVRLYALTFGKWLLVQGGETLEGDAYVEDFSGNGSVPITITTVSGVDTVKLLAGRNFHFWLEGWPRPTLPSGVTGLFATYQARIVPDDASKPLDGAGRLIANVGADWYATNTSTVQPGGIQPGAGQGRFIVLTGAWQALNFCTVPEATLRANPPPYT